MKVLLRLPLHALVPAFLALGAAGSLPAAPVHAQVVEGVLVESGAERRVTGGILTLTDTTGATLAMSISDEEGGFRLQAPGAGAYLVVASAVGYATAADGVLELGPDGFVEITFYLMPAPLELPGITASVERVRTERYLDQQGFYDRMQAGFGNFITPEEIERRMPNTSQDLLRRVPGLRVSDGGFAGQSIQCTRGRREARTPVLFVDGSRVAAIRNDALGGATIDLEQIVDLHNIAGVEVYTGASQVPLEYGGINGDCVVLVWTKRYRR